MTFNGTNVSLNVGDKTAHFDRFEAKMEPVKLPDIRFIPLSDPDPIDDMPTFSAVDHKALQWLEAVRVGDTLIELAGQFVPRNLAAVRLAEKLCPPTWSIELKAGPIG